MMHPRYDDAIASIGLDAVLVELDNLRTWNQAVYAIRESEREAAREAASRPRSARGHLRVVHGSEDWL